jgi:DNA-binding transcriptional MerR regulator
MRIGELADEAGVNVQTIRFYEREGLLPKPARTASGYRQYRPTDTERVRFIRVCQGLGFTLREIVQLIRLHGVAASPMQALAVSRRSSEKILEIAHDRLSSIEEKIEQLSRMRSEMQGVIRSLSSSSTPRCPAASAAE